jgi:hypothetical protein
MREKRVYFLRPVGQRGPIKIGCSCFPEGRMDWFTLWSPQPLELVCSVPGKHADEKTLHGMFHADHLHGEWFGPSAELLALVEHCTATGSLPPLPKVLRFPETRHKGHSTDKPPPVDRLAWAARIRAEYEGGASAASISAKHNINYSTVLRLVRLAGGKIRRPGPPACGFYDMDRAAKIAQRYLAGETLQQIADDFGLSRERIRQILAKMQITPATKPTGAIPFPVTARQVAPSRLASRVLSRWP